MNTWQEIAETLRFNAINCVAEDDLADALLTLEVMREVMFKAADALASTPASKIAPMVSGAAEDIAIMPDDDTPVEVNFRTAYEIEKERLARKAAALEPLSQAEGQEPVAWRWRYMHPEEEPSGWHIQQKAMEPVAPREKTRGIEAEPLYTHPAETLSGQSIAAPSRAEIDAMVTELNRRLLMDGEAIVHRSDVEAALKTAALSPSATNVDSDGER